MRNDNNNNLGRILKQRRVMALLTLREIATMSGISSSHLGRIERGERFPSATILQKIAKPLNFEEGELLCLAGYLSPQATGIAEEKADYSGRQLDPYVSQILSQEPVEVQRAIIGLLSILKSIAKTMK
ncbi:hypothetical protein ES703_51327 [subsurface metagenome]